jgi:hypothetical protein
MSDMPDAVAHALDALESRLPQLLQQYPSAGDFWPAFACEEWEVYDLARELTGSSEEAIARVKAMLERAQIDEKLRIP